MDIEIIKRLAKINKLAIKEKFLDNLLYLEEVWEIAKLYNISTIEFDVCNAQIDYKTNEIEFYLYCESYHNGTSYNNKVYKHVLTEEAFMVIVNNLKSKAVEIVEKQLKNEEVNRFKIAAEKIVSEIISK